MTFIYREFRNHSHDRRLSYKATHMTGHPLIRHSHDKTPSYKATHTIGHPLIRPLT